MSLFSGNAVAQLIFQSDALSKAVLLVLFFLSILCWTLFMQRFFLLRIKRAQVGQARAALGVTTTFEQLKIITATSKDTYAGLFLTSAQELLVVEHDREQFAQQLAASVDTLVHKEVSSMSLFSTAAEISPLLGLFGTIWGLIHSFIRISERQSADIVTVAPGIAEALITTLAGLLVAIPALVLYHALMAKVRDLEDALWSLANRYEQVARNIWEKELVHAHTQQTAAEKLHTATNQSHTAY